MSLFMLGGPKLQLFNNEGHPYSDSEGVTENEQPVEMDAAGRPDSGAVYLSPVAYKFVCKDADGVLIWTQDHYRPPTMP